MKCTACGCPGAYELLRGVICWNRSCRNFHKDVIDGSVYDDAKSLVNGDEVADLKRFLKEHTPDGQDFIR